MNSYFKSLIILFVLFGTSCASYKPFYSKSEYNWQDEIPADSSEVIYSLFLIGDSKRAYTNDPLLSMMESHLAGAGEQSAVVFLGDNVYPNGLPDSTHRSWDVAQKSLLAQLDILQKFKGEIIFMPGNHDWARGKSEGLQYVKNQRKFIEDYLDKDKVFLPSKGRAGPAEVHLTEDIVLIIIDSHWWFHENEKSFAGIEDEADFFVQIEDAISRNRDKKIVFAAHNPLYSVGNHGGHFTAADNLFPLLNVNRALYIPLPGFIYTGYRKFLGYHQDLSHPQYKMLIEALLETFEGHSNIIYAAGHEHNLQYVSRDSIHHIISGAAGSSTYVAHSEKTDFAQMEYGMAKLNFYANGDVWLEFWVSPDDQSVTANKIGPNGILSFRKRLFNKPMYLKEEHQQFLSEIDLSDSTITTYPNGEVYQAGKFKRVFFGDNYREEWITPVEVPVFDFNRVKGGLEIVKKGGGGQTKSLRLENSEGKQWVLRSLEKDPSKVIPEVVKTEIAVDIVQDQMSASLPWAALSVPRLAESVGIYHTNPEIFYLTKDPRLGEYLDDVWEGLYLLEERPDGNRDDILSFGRSENIIGTPDMLDEIVDDHDHLVDQDHFLKCRLMDVFIGDWDRHEDQWRWAGFKKGDETIYRSVPRDRDQTFFLNEGIFPWMSSRKSAVRINQGFDYEINDMAGLVSQGRWLDRRFLNELTLDDWLETASIMQTQLSDEVIEAAVYDMPEQIAEMKGATIISKLKVRRDKLQEFATTYYSIISSEVDIVGSDKSERFQVERLNDEETKVTVYTLNKKGKKKEKYYQRTFRHSETKEIRLYGLKGKDEFHISGEVDKGIKIRIVGGPQKDEIKDKSEVKGWTGKIRVYDDDKYIYRYNAFNYRKSVPLAFVGYNADDFIVLGAGLMMTSHGFQKFPYATHHQAVARYASATNALEFIYDGIFTSAFMGLDFQLHLDIRDPRYTQNYFGLGNETEQGSDDKDFNRVRIGHLGIHPELSKTINNNTFSAGLFYQQYNVEETPERFISDIPVNGLDPEIFENQDYTGINARYQFDTRNSQTLPTRGLYWNTNASFYYNLDNAGKTFNQITSELSLFMSFKKPHRTVFAFRVGGSANIGDYEFFQASSLGGKTNLRGYRATRFSGDASLYQNSEIRFKLFKFSTYISKGELGVLAFNDIGRVWLEGENSNQWHHGYGGGIWASPFNIAVLSATYERSKDELSGLFSLRFKYLF